jgi:hypothetical protein
MRHRQKQTSESEYDGFPIQRAEPSDRSPRGLRPVDAVHRDGMGFVVWFEPERVWRGTYIAQDGMILVVPQADAALYTAKGGGRNRLDFAPVRL